MAQRTVITYTCDLSGEPADETVRFGLDKAQYEIDLTEVHAKQLHDALLPYLEAGRKVTRTRPARAAAPVRTDPEQSRAIRDWARANGHKVSDRGRISATVMAAFAEAH